ncbi:MAG: histidine kinase [Gemmatimonadaceae bacterium]
MSSTTIRRLELAALAFLLWTTFGLLSSAHFFLGKEAGAGGASYSGLVAHILLFYWMWVALTPLLLVVARYSRPLGPRTIAIVAAAAPLLVLMHGVLYLLAVRFTGVEPAANIGLAELEDYAMRHAGGDLATLAALFGVYLLLDATRRARDREILAAGLEARLARADLEVRRGQLQPHFLFNALNTVSTLVLKGDTAGADHAVSAISRYLRSALAQRADLVVTLAEELILVRQYAAIETIRFGSLLDVEIDATDDALAIRIPSSILQPLVENAIRHGELGPIAIAAAIANSRLRVNVTNVCADDARSPGVGFGLSYVRQRLAHCYGNDAHVEVAVGDATRSTVVSLDLPVTA